MKIIISICMFLMMLIGCSNNVPANVKKNVVPLSYYSEYQGDGWMYYGLYFSESKSMWFTGVYMRHYNLPGHYIYGYSNGELVEKLPTSIANLDNGEMTRDDMKKIDGILKETHSFPVSLDNLQLEVIDPQLVESIVNKTYEQPIVNGQWEHGPNRLIVQREMDSQQVLSVGQVTSDGVIIATFIDFYDGENYLRDEIDLTEDEKRLVKEFERIEKEMLVKQEYLVIEDSDDPMMHELYMALRQLDMTAEKKH